MKRVTVMSKLQISGFALVINLAFPVAANNSVVLSTSFSQLEPVEVKVSVPHEKEKKMLVTVELAIDALPVKLPVDVLPEHRRGILPKTVDPVVFEEGAFRLFENTGVVEFSLSKGLLKPQVVELLLHHRLIDSTDDIQWGASGNFMWPNSHTISGKTLDHVINAVLAPYQLVADFKGNGNVIINKW